MKYNLKKGFCFTAAISVICAVAVGFAGRIDTSVKKEVFAAESKSKIIMQIDNPVMTADGEEIKIDENGTVPIIVNGRTLVPIRAIVEKMGGNVEWNGSARQTTLNYENNKIVLTLDSTTAYLNDSENILDTAPAAINGRTMLPIRFIAESFGFDVDWNVNTHIITITSKKANEENKTIVSANITENKTENENAPVVYITNNISSEAVMNIYNQLKFTPSGKVAVKLSTGEAGNTHYLDPDLIKDLVQSVGGTIVECNTAYGGSRAETALHKQVAQDHGFTAIANVDIMDENGSIQIPVSDKAENLKYDIVGKNYENYDSMLVLSHFKGHAMGGFGGAVKNISIGIGSSKGKMYIHSGGHSETSWSSGTQDEFLESMAEAAQAVHNNKQNDGGIVYISVMNHLSVDCDCDGNPAEPEMNDVGILASYDPVALDQACVDIVYNTDRSESGALIERIESRNGIHTLEHAEKIGLGSREYKLVNID